MADENATDERQFAYGSSEQNGWLCPAKSAGYNPYLGTAMTPVINQIADHFDGEVQERNNENVGVVSESVAKDVWLDLIERYNNGERSYSDRYSELAEDVADKLGWINE